MISLMNSIGRGEQNLVYPGNNGMVMKRRISEKTSSSCLFCMPFPHKEIPKAEKEKGRLKEVMRKRPNYTQKYIFLVLPSVSFFHSKAKSKVLLKFPSNNT